jgi:thioredoxin-related protein
MTFADEEVVNYVSKNAFALKVDVDKDNTLKQKYYVSEYPTVLIFDKNGAMKMRFEGFFTAESFLETLKNINK